MADSIDRPTSREVPPNTTTSTSGSDRLDRYLESVRQLERVSTGRESSKSDRATATVQKSK